MFALWAEAVPGLSDRPTRPLIPIIPSWWGLLAGHMSLITSVVSLASKKARRAKMAAVLGRPPRTIIRVVREASRILTAKYCVSVLKKTIPGASASGHPLTHSRIHRSRACTRSVYAGVRDPHLRKSWARYLNLAGLPG